MTIVFNTNKEKYVLGKDISLILPEKYCNSIKTHFSRIERTKSIKERLKKEIGLKDIEKSLANLKNMILGITQNCNLRCRYCSYSGIYKYQRTHSQKNMAWATAKKAVDLYFEKLNSKFRTDRTLDRRLSFFGGEPLLEFDTILKTIRYTREKNRSMNKKLYFIFMISTNGMLLNQEYIKTIVKEDIELSISFDGPQSEHDKFRVKPNGEGSWRTILKNVKNIKENFPEYYENKIRFLITVHPHHNLREIEKYLLNHKDLFHEGNVVINSIRNYNFKDPNVQNVFQMKKHRNLEQLDKNEWVYKRMCEYGYRLNNTSLLNDNTVFTGMCDLGVTRVFVDVDGNLHSCEQIIDAFPIGNVVEGYNLETIKKLLENWNNEIKKNECWNCDIWMLCDFCFANSCNREEISLNKCNIAKNNIKNILLPRYVALLEKEDEGFKTCECDTISDFLELL